VLIATGVTGEGHWTLQGPQAEDKESASNWRRFFKDLKRQGLHGNGVSLAIMDRLSGLESVFRGGFPNAKIQRS